MLYLFACAAERLPTNATFPTGPRIVIAVVIPALIALMVWLGQRSGPSA